MNLFWFRARACFAYDKTVINQSRVEILRMSQRKIQCE